MTTDVDTRLRQYAARWRAAQADETAKGIPGPVSALPRRRRRRPALAIAASVVAVAAVVVGAILIIQRPALVAGPSASTSAPLAVVPWSSAGVRAHTATVPAPKKVGAGEGMRRCPSTEFALISNSTRPDPSRDGWLATSFVLQATGSTPCSVPNGSIPAALITDTGAALPTDVVLLGPVPVPRMLAVQPGRLVFGSVSWAVYAGRVPRPARLVIDPDGRLDTARDPSIPLASVTIPPHPRGPTGQAPWRSAALASIRAIAEPGTLATLTASVTAPPTVAAGSILRYTVTVTNPTRTSVPLATCPAFAEQLAVTPVKESSSVGFTGPLNCGEAPTAVGAGRSVTFHYELPTRGEIPGPGRLTWQLVDHGVAVVRATAVVKVQS